MERDAKGSAIERRILALAVAMHRASAANDDAAWDEACEAFYALLDEHRAARPLARQILDLAIAARDLDDDHVFEAAQARLWPLVAEYAKRLEAPPPPPGRRGPKPRPLDPAAVERALEEAGSIRGAARLLGVSQSGLQARLAGRRSRRQQG